MSTAGRVPETYELTGEDARATLRRAQAGLLLKDAFIRFRFADGFSHARALAFQLVLAMVPAAVVAVGLATYLGESHAESVIRGTFDSLAPGPAGEVFRSAFREGADAGREGLVAILVGSVGWLWATTVAFGQVERGANRIYGVERDRPSSRKYALAAALTLSAGLLLLVFFVLVTIGDSVVESLPEGTVATVWSALRWPLGILLLVAAFALVFRHSPRRHQPGFTWLAVGASLAVVGVGLVSGLLHWYVGGTRSLGETYGPLAGFIGLMLWANLSSIAFFFGLGFAAQLEAFRAGQAQPARSQTEEELTPAVTAGNAP